MMIFLFRIVFNVFAFVGTIADSKQIFNSSVLSWNALQYVRGARKVLNIVEGCAQSGRVLGVIGPSGCGKTTLLRVIALRSMATHGKITWMKGSSPMVLRRADISFVHQDDSFFSMLTVRETINLAAQFRRYKYRATFDTDYLNELLFYVGLESIANSKVGSVKGNSESDVSRGERQSSSSGISGGERKRLALACELVGRPAILLADEPTSGLDAFQAQQVMQLFHEQSRTENCIVICAIHQPRSSIWGIFDDIMLLTPDGRTAYHGSRAAAAGYFQNIGYSFPEATNPAEFLIDLVSHDTSSRNAMQNSLQRIEELVMAYENRNRTTEVLLGRENSLFTLEASRGDSFATKVLQRFTLASLWNVPMRIGLLVQRTLRQVCRDNSSNLVRVAMSAVLAGVISAVYGRPGSALSDTNVSAHINIIAQGVINVAMLSLIKTLQLFKSERGVVSRERGAGLYSAAEYLIAKSAVELPVDALVAAVSVLATYRVNIYLYNSALTCTIVLCDSSVLTYWAKLLSGAVCGFAGAAGNRVLSAGPRSIRPCAFR